MVKLKENASAGSVKSNTQAAPSHPKMLSFKIRGVAYQHRQYLRSPL